MSTTFFFFYFRIEWKSRDIFLWTHIFALFSTLRTKHHEKKTAALYLFIYFFSLFPPPLFAKHSGNVLLSLSFFSIHPNVPSYQVQPNPI